jgi:hypothetical protein
MQPFEKLGAFYLGRRFDPATGRAADEPILYDAKDLTTHAVCVGMTGSGKTGLCLTLLEEAAIDAVPAIAIDPKGDIGNLLLTFPDLRATDFEPWVSASDAARKGVTVPEYASEVAEKWRQGLADWGQDAERIRRLREAAEIAIYTPGSTAGRPLSVLRSLKAPPATLGGDADAMRERVTAAASGLLTLLGFEADPVRSREHILISRLLDDAWRAGRDLEVGDLIRLVQAPPFDRIGVIDLETFFPAADRFALAMTLNNLLASPGFAAWLEGEPLDVQRLLWTESGKPRISILAISHLSDAERMFFVTLLLNEVVSWVRSQPGSTSLRALLYMDEVFGFFPPVANPPSKPPMLTLLKQARAFGLGVVVATQNPVDLDYKGLSNAGTWFLGRLQTERDKQRVLDGLESAAAGAGFDRKAIDELLSGLQGRVFYLHNVHEDAPVLMQTRWAMSYLRGPLTREEIKRLTPGPAAPTPAPAPAVATAVPPARVSERPLVQAGVEELFLRARAGHAAGHYRPALLGRVRLHFVSAKQKLDDWQERCVVAGLPASASVWDEASVPERVETQSEPVPGFAFGEVPAEATRAAAHKSWQKSLGDWAYRTQVMTLWHCAALGSTSAPGQSEGDFRVRLTQEARERRDLEVEKLRQDYAPKLQRIDERIRTARQRMEREQSQVSQQTLSAAISVGATVLGAMFGRKLGSVGNVGRATESLEVLQQQQEALNREFEARSAAIQEAFDPGALQLESIEVRPRKTDIAAAVALVWQPWTAGPGLSEPLY